MTLRPPPHLQGGSSRFFPEPAGDRGCRGPERGGQLRPKGGGGLHEQFPLSKELKEEGLGPVEVPILGVSGVTVTFSRPGLYV